MDVQGHEDLRQDERVMQLFGLVNSMLTGDRTTKEQDLSIARYAVIPLSPNSGGHSWVSTHAAAVPANVQQQMRPIWWQCVHCTTGEQDLPIACYAVIPLPQAHLAVFRHEAHRSSNQHSPIVAGRHSTDKVEVCGLPLSASSMACDTSLVALAVQASE